MHQVMIRRSDGAMQAIWVVEGKGHTRHFLINTLACSFAYQLELLIITYKYLVGIFPEAPSSPIESTHI
jgi:hypothetical protein